MSREMNALEFVNHAHKMTNEFHTSFLGRILETSKGEPEMSAKDMKLAIMSLISIVKSQEEIIQKLVSEANIAKEERNDANEEFLRNRKS